MSENGSKWIKIKCQDPFTIQLECLAPRSSKKGKNVLKISDGLINAAKQNPIKFQPPKIFYVFGQGVTR